MVVQEQLLMVHAESAVVPLAVLVVGLAVALAVALAVGLVYWPKKQTAALHTE